MKGQIPRIFIDELLMRIDIIDVISARVPLKKAGREFKACCPFHNEKTPSFTVSSSKQFYHCFGCGVHGSAISFLMDYDHLGFVEAIEALAQSLGLEIPYEASGRQQTQQQKSAIQDAYSVMERVTTYYQQQLVKTKNAVNYLKRRGLSEEIQQRFSIGYAPVGWNNIGPQFQQTCSKQQLLEVGLIIEKEDGGQYDRFRDRIMFPIRDPQGRVVAFGGRVLKNEMPKYLNSPETFIFHKGLELYGLFEARKQTRKLERIVVVEGYMDVIALAQYGVSYSIATLGTATTTEHIKKLSRLVPEIIFCFDGDQAGRKAAWRALENALPIIQDHLKIAFLFLPDGEDPDSQIRKIGREDFENLLNEATVFSDFFLSHLKKQYDIRHFEGRAALVSQALTLLKQMQSNLLQAQLIQSLSQISKINQQRIQYGLQELSRKSVGLIDASKDHQQLYARQLKMTPIRMAIALLLHEPSLVQFVENAEAIALYQLPGVTFLTRLIGFIEEQPYIDNETSKASNMSPSTNEPVFAFNAAVLMERWRETRYEKILLELMRWQPIDEDKHVLQREFQDCLRQITKQEKAQKLEKLRDKEQAEGLSLQERNDLLALLMGQ